MLSKKIISGLSKNDVFYLVDLAKHFEKGSGNENNSISENKIFNILKYCQEKNPNVSDNIKEKLFVDDKHLELSSKKFHELMHDFYYESICNWVLNSPFDIEYLSMDMFCRVVNDIQVFYIPEDIERVTESFI